MQNLTSVLDLIKQSFQIYFKKENLIYLVKIALVTGLLILVLLIPSMVLYFLTTFLGTLLGLSLDNNTFVIILYAFLGIVGVTAFLVGVFWMPATVIVAVSKVVKGEIIGVKETLSLAWKKLWKFILLELLTSVIVGLGFLLLAVPGIIFGVWFSFAGFILITQDKGVVESLKESKALIKGRFWKVVGRYLVFILLGFLVQFGVSLVPFVGAVILMLASPYFTILPYLLYEDLRKSKFQ